MINELQAKKYCYEDISKIENYAKAVADNTQTWDCHHRWETDRGLSEKELEFCSEYYYVPADRLIFLTHSEHRRLHMSGEKNPMYGKTHSTEAKQKMSEAARQRTGENNPMYGKKLSAEHKQKLIDAHIGMKWWTDGQQNKFMFECPGPEWKRGRLPYSQIKETNT